MENIANLTYPQIIAKPNQTKPKQINAKPKQTAIASLGMTSILIQAPRTKDFKEDKNFLFNCIIS